VTRLPTERLATACWDPIVAISIVREPAPLLQFQPLQQSDIQSYPQVINRPVGEFGNRLNSVH
jgi:hypothetical protein